MRRCRPWPYRAVLYGAAALPGLTEGDCFSTPLAAALRLPGGLVFVGLDCQPLHVRWRVRAAALQRRDVIYLPAWARAASLPGHRAWMGAHELCANRCGPVGPRQANRRRQCQANKHCGAYLTHALPQWPIPHASRTRAMSRERSRRAPLDSPPSSHVKDRRAPEGYCEALACRKRSAMASSSDAGRPEIDRAT